MDPRRASTRPPDLAAWRKRAGISLPAIAGTTKIAVRYLDAIERGQFEILPGGAYSISYVRQYAQAIHYDADDLVAYYLRVTAPQEFVTVAASAPSPNGRVRRWIRSLRTIALSGGIPHLRD